MSKGNDKENISIFYLLNNFKYTIICTTFFVFIIIIKIFEIGKRKNDASSKISTSKNDSIFQTRNLRKKRNKKKKNKNFKYQNNLQNLQNKISSEENKIKEIGKIKKPINENDKKKMTILLDLLEKFNLLLF